MVNSIYLGNIDNDDAVTVNQNNLSGIIERGYTSEYYIEIYLISTQI